MVRCFEDKDIMHVANEVNPVNDKEVINMELILADIETVKNVLNRIGKKAKSGDKTAILEQNLCLKLQEKLEKWFCCKNIRKLNTRRIKNYQILSFINIQTNDLCS